MLPDFNQTNALAIKRVVGLNNSNFSKICVTMRSVRSLWKGSRYHYNDRLNYCYYARGSLEETKSWILKAKRRKLIKTQISEINHAIELLPKTQ